MPNADFDAEPRQWVSLTRPELVEHALRRGEGILSRTGSLVVESITPEDNFSADRYIVEEASTEDVIDWRRNQSFNPDEFDKLWLRAETLLADDDRYVQFVHAGDDVKHYLPVEVVTQTAWQSLSALNLFTPTDKESYNNKGKQEWQILNVPSFICQPDRDKTLGDRAVITHYARRKILILGMHNGGEMKKAMFTVLSFLLPERGVLPLHSAASLNKENQSVTLLAGASGSGKTTLATGKNLTVIGDDEIGWGKKDLFNLEGGYYLRTSQLKAAEANEWLSPARFGAVTENAELNEERALDFTAMQTLQNGRCAYPFANTRHAPMSMLDAMPDYFVILVCDYSGVIPPVARLTHQAAVYHYLLGYNTELVKQDDQIVVEPEFRSCFIAPYLPRPSVEFAELLAKRLRKSEAKAFLMNTGVLGDVNQGAERVPVELSQQLLAAIQAGQLDEVAFQKLEPLGFEIPVSVAAVANDQLDPATYWRDSDRYLQVCATMAERFQQEADHWALPDNLRTEQIGG